MAGGPGHRVPSRMRGLCSPKWRSREFPVPLTKASSLPANPNKRFSTNPYPSLGFKFFYHKMKVLILVSVSQNITWGAVHIKSSVVQLEMLFILLLDTHDENGSEKSTGEDNCLTSTEHFPNTFDYRNSPPSFVQTLNFLLYGNYKRVQTGRLSTSSTRLKSPTPMAALLLLSGYNSWGAPSPFWGSWVWVPSPPAFSVTLHYPFLISFSLYLYLDLSCISKPLPPAPHKPFKHS